MSDEDLSDEELAAIRDTLAPTEESQVKDLDLAASDRLFRRGTSSLERRFATISRGVRRVVKSTLPFAPSNDGDDRIEILGPQAATELVQGFSACGTLAMESQGIVGVVGLEPGLSFACVEQAFGASPNPENLYVPDRAHSVVEHATVLPFMEGILDAVNKVFATSDLTAEVSGHRESPELPARLDAVTVWRIAVGDAAIVLVMVPFLVDLIVSGSAADMARPHPEWMLGHLSTAAVEISAVLGRQSITVRELMDMKVGKVIRLDRRQSQPVPVLIEGRAKYFASPVKQQSTFGVEIKEHMNSKR